MSQTVYVLMSFEGSGKRGAWRPVAVVSNPDLATQWGEYGANVDWVPLELDEVKNISPEDRPTFQPRKTTPGEEKAIELSGKVEATLQRMQKVIDDQQTLIKKLTKGKKSASESPHRVAVLSHPVKGRSPKYSVSVIDKSTGNTLHSSGPVFDSREEAVAHGREVSDKLRGMGGYSDAENPLDVQRGHEQYQKESSEDKIPPRPVERIKGGTQPFPQTLDARGIADHIETYAVYPVDSEFVYEKFQGAHATLKLVPIASLREGGRDQNLQRKKTEDKYLKQSLKTQPPIVVENGEVLDGNHRLRANKRRGLTHTWCYVVTDGEAPNGDADASGSSQS